MVPSLKNASYVDLLIHKMDKARFPNWLFYPLLVLLFTVADRLIFIYEDGAGYFESFYGVFSTTWTLFINHAMYRLAISTFDQFKPSLELSDERVESHRRTFLFSNPWIGWITLIAGIFTFLIFWTAGIESGLLETTRSAFLAFIYGLFLFGANSAFITYFMINSIRRLRRIVLMHGEVRKINLLDLDPLRAFSRFSSSTAIALLLSVAIFARFGFDLDDVIFYGVLVILSILVFVVPLVSLRNKISVERDKQLKEISADLAVISRKMRHAIHQDDLPSLGSLRQGQEGLKFQREELNQINPWPWNFATLRGFSSAILLPIFIWLVTRLLERVL